ncbi:hypothetical protein BC830DRAFT_746282 [Chytriomyces sp. MP71]|nr:hypothetical protein BC830DRAFT_746282 [Chytriomyces sp. MP71]
MPSNPVSPKIASTDTGASLRTSHFNSRDTNVPISPSSNDVCVGTLDSSSDPRDEPRTPLKKPPTWYASDSFPGTPQPASNFSSPGNKVRSGFASSRDSPSGAKCLKHGFSDSSEEDTPDVHSRRTSRSSSYSNRQSCRPSELKSIRSGSHNLPTTSRDQPQQQRNLAQFSSTKQHRADSIDSEVICPPPRSPSPLATKFSSTKASMASIFRKPSRQRLDPDEMGSGMLSPSVTTPSRISSVFGRRPTMDGIDNDSTAQRGRGRSLSRSSKAVRSQSMPVDISRSRSTADREMNFEFSELNYRHESIAGRVLQLFRDFDKSNVVPEYLKRRIPRYACFVVPHIHQIEAKLDEWTWLVNFCENWGLSPLGLIMGVFLLTAMHRVYRRNARYISSYVGFVYPLYRTIVTFLQPAPAELSIFQAPKSINMSKYEYEVAKWKAYWPIYGSILVLDEFSSVLLRIYPFYFTTRTVFCYWLYHNNGAAYLFYKYIEPLWQSGVAAMTAVDDVVSATGLTAFG